MRRDSRTGSRSIDALRFVQRHVGALQQLFGSVPGLPFGAADRARGRRYRSQPVACGVAGALSPGEYRRIELVLTEPFLAAAPGQVACLLAGERVVGHGVIAEREIARAA